MHFVPGIGRKVRDHHGLVSNPRFLALHCMIFLPTHYPHPKGKEYTCLNVSQDVQLEE